MEVKRKRRAERKTIVVIPDVHLPKHDPESLAIAENLCAHLQPDIIVQIGDLLDVYKLSRFDKDPASKTTLQDELDHGVEFWRRIRDRNPHAELHWKEGNHEERLRKFLWSKAGELACLRALDFTELMCLDKFGVTFHAANSRFNVGPLKITHGKATGGGRSGNAAHAELSCGVSGISGHTHRLARVWHSNDAGTREWIEAGCLCRLDAEYVGDKNPNWQHGLVVGHWIQAHDINRVDLQIVPIQGGVAHYQGDLITAEGVLTA